jgi:hypothetical protein
MPLEIRLVKESEYKAVNDFFNSARSIDHHGQKVERPFENFLWEFINGPSGKAIYAIAIDVESGKEPKIVGIQCAIPLKMIASNGENILTSKGEDTFIDIRAQIKYRKVDILKELYSLIFEECLKNGIESIWGFNSIMATIKRMGFDFPFKSFYGVLVLKPINAYKHIIALNAKNSNFDKIKISMLSGFSFLYSIKRNLFLSKIKNYNLNFEMSDNVDLFKRASSPDSQLFFLIQDNEYLKWRITQNPYKIEYKSFQIINHQNIIQAQVICSFNNNVAFIEQMLFDKNLNRKIIYSLLKKIIQSIYKENICLIRFSGFKTNNLNKEQIKILKDIGFIFTKKGEQFAFKKLSDNSVISPHNIFLSRLYKQGRM